MSNYRKTMTEALQEMKPLNERMRMGRQLINPNKEVMVVKKNKVVVIDKKDQDKYMKQGWELAEEVELDESVIDKVKEIASKKQAKKIGGVMVDSFTASAISQIYDKVNDANKKKMEKLPITKLANLAFKMMQKNEFVPEEVGLDEGTKQVLAHGGKGQYKAVRDGSITKVMYKGKVVGTADFDRGADSFFASIKGEKGQKSFDDAQAMVDYFAKNKITEEVDLDEADDFKPHMMYDPKTGKGYKADTMDDHLRMKKMGYTHDAPKKEEVELDENEGLKNKSKKSGISVGILKKVYNRGLAAYKTGHRPGTSAPQWAMARVNSFITKGSGTWGGADKDLAKQAGGKSEEIEEDFFDPITEACWAGYKQVGMKKKGGKEVPNCVPEEVDLGEESELNEWGEIEEVSEYQGRNVTLNKASAGDVKKSKVYVKNENGTVVKVNFGDPNISIKKSDPARRKSFRARHNCDTAKDKTTARYWSCYQWRANAPVNN